MQWHQREAAESVSAEVATSHLKKLLGGGVAAVREGLVALPAHFHDTVGGDVHGAFDDGALFPCRH